MKKPGRNSQDPLKKPSCNSSQNCSGNRGGFWPAAFALKNFMPCGRPDDMVCAKQLGPPYLQHKVLQINQKSSWKFNISLQSSQKFETAEL